MNNQQDSLARDQLRDGGKAMWSLFVEFNR
jgi:hypothetical protein